MNTLFHKITRRAQQDRKLFAVVQPDAIYFSATQDSPLRRVIRSETGLG
ncbi:hypothetical protein ACT691_10250 [Vibrio metschnikovii]